MYETKALKELQAVERAGLRSIVRVSKIETKSTDELRGALKATLAKAAVDMLRELAGQVGAIVAGMTSGTEAQNEISTLFDVARQSTLTLTRTAATKAGMTSWMAAALDTSGNETPAQKKRANDKGFIWQRASWVGEAMGVPGAKSKVQEKDQSHLPIWEREQDKSQADNKRAFLAAAGFDEHGNKTDDDLKKLLQDMGIKSSDEVDLDALLKQVQFKDFSPEKRKVFVDLFGEEKTAEFERATKKKAEELKRLGIEFR